MASWPSPASTRTATSVDDSGKTSGSADRQTDTAGLPLVKRDLKVSFRIPVKLNRRQGYSLLPRVCENNRLERILLSSTFQRYQGHPPEFFNGLLTGARSLLLVEELLNNGITGEIVRWPPSQMPQSIDHIVSRPCSHSIVCFGFAAVVQSY